MKERIAAAYRVVPRWLKIATGSLTLIAAVGAYGAWTVGMGRSAIEKIARERGFCKLDGCPDGVNYVESVLSVRYGTSATTIEWCLGVDEWRATRVYRGGLLKAILVDVMDTPCGKLKPATAAAS